MSPSLKIFALSTALLLIFSASGYSQYGQLPFANQVSIVEDGPTAGYGAYDQYGQPVSYRSYQYPAQVDPVNELYNNNAQKPLRGLFAKGFTRTLTVLGGANFLNSIEGEESLLSPIPALGSLSSTALESETGYAISFAFGRRHNHRLRSEIELALRDNDTSFEFEPSAFDDIFGIALPANGEDEIRTYSVMKNFIFDFPNASRFTPYVGVGLGWSYVDLEAPSIGIDDGIGAFSYQAIGGLATTLNNAADFIVEYRFFATAEVDVAGIPITYNAHNLFLGIKFEY